MSYIFYCDNKTVEECFSKALFGNTYRHWDTVKRIKEGDPIFLINLDSGTLYGPFIATRKSELNLDPYAFIKSGRNFPAQVEIKWNKLMKMSRPYSKLKFLDGRKTKLSQKETVKLIMTLIEEDSKYIHRWV